MILFRWNISNPAVNPRWSPLVLSSVATVRSTLSWHLAVHLSLFNIDSTDQSKMDFFLLSFSQGETKLIQLLVIQDV